MAADRWTRIDELFHAALPLDAAARDALLHEACGGDAALRDEIATLLAMHDRAGDFIEQPLHVTHADLMEAPGTLGPEDPRTPAPSDPGPLPRSLGHYRLQEVLGRGGMGVVYRAEDTRLGRTVAIKALAPRWTANPSHRERLRREARAAAALSHPGIAVVHALEEFDGDLFLVSEFLPGRTLREEVGAGALPPGVLMSTALEIARALAAAHAHGVVHRDLKPENVMRLPNGRVKILDFGLALVQNPSDAAAPTDLRLTEAGALLGTPAYMAPEQLRGRSVDFRADLYAFGLMLDELGTGGLPAAGAEAASTLAGLPASLRPIVHRCLRDAPAARYDSTDELVRALEAAAGDVDSAPPARLAAPASPRWWWQMHQLAVTGVYGAMLVPWWFVRTWMPAAWAMTMFLTAVVAVAAAASLRLHLWFTSRVYPEEWAEQRARIAGWIRVADVAVVALLLLTALAVAADHQGVGALFAGVAVGALIASLVIEPATTRVAFRQ